MTNAASKEAAASRRQSINARGAGRSRSFPRLASFVPVFILYLLSHLLKLESHLVDLAVKFERRGVIEVAGRATVLADILSFVERVFESSGLIDAGLTHLLAISK